MIRNILIAILFIVLFMLYYQNSELSSYAKVLEQQNSELQVKLNKQRLKQQDELTLQYLSPLYKQTRFYSALPYEYQWYLQSDYEHIQNYQKQDVSQLAEFYEELPILPEIIYDKQNEDLSIKLQLKKVF